MNVFEDLIGELKDENLLEDTVIEVKRRSTGGPAPNGAVSLEPDRAGFDIVPVVSDETARATATSGENLVDKHAGDVPEITRAADQREFFRKRAMEEVSSLQMVEHVLSGVEREHLKMPAAPYDDLKVKKALHKFLQVSGDVSSVEHAEAEYELLQETQGWHSALSARDKNVSVASIRRFCENSRPALSSQALMALARFYRNSPFTEDVRGKFDYVMTRLFSRDSGEEKRKLLFRREDMIGHIKTLYANWSSISYHTSDEDKNEIDLAVQRFNDLICHFEAADTFDQLLEADIFNTIRSYKEECGEMFYVPDLTAVVIECNVRLGNKYVDLIFAARSEMGAAPIEEKYGYTYDQIVSNAAGKTLLLVDLLRNRDGSDEGPVDEKPAFEQESFDLPNSAKEQKELSSTKGGDIFGINKWLLAVTVLITIASGSIYFWADKIAGPSGNIAVATEVDITATGLQEHLKTVRATNETLYAVTQPSWDALSEEDKKQFLRKVLDFAQTKGYKKVNLLNYRARTVAFATGDRLELIAPH